MGKNDEVLVEVKEKRGSGDGRRMIRRVYNDYTRNNNDEKASFSAPVKGNK